MKIRYIQENQERSKMNMAMPIHTGLSNAPKQENFRQYHFTLQQISLIGDLAGVLDGSFDMPANVLTKKELADKIRKLKEATERALAFAGQSFTLGQRIVELDEHVDKKITLVRDKINQLSGVKGAEETIRQLKKQKTSLTDLKKDLKISNEERRDSKTITDLVDVVKSVFKTEKKIEETEHTIDKIIDSEPTFSPTNTTGNRSRSDFQSMFSDNKPAAKKPKKKPKKKTEENDDNPESSPII